MCLHDLRGFFKQILRLQRAHLVGGCAHGIVQMGAEYIYGLLRLLIQQQLPGAVAHVTVHNAEGMSGVSVSQKTPSFSSSKRLCLYRIAV